MAHIGRLREKLNDSYRNPKFIKTVWGVGYRLNKIYKSNRNMKRFRRSLSVRIFRKYILTSVIFSVSMAVFLVISKVFLSRYIWYEDSMMYQLFHWIDRNALFTIIFVSVVGWIIIFFYYWLRTFRYLERLIYATEELYESEDLIHLPDERRKWKIF